MRRRRYEFIVGAGLLVIFVVSVVGRGLSRPVLLGAAMIVALYFIGRRAAPAIRRAVRASRRRPEIDVTLQPDTLRPGPRPVSSLKALKATLEASGLGTVTAPNRHSLLLVDAEGRLVSLAVPSPDEVTASEVSLHTDSLELALLACDALVARLGPVTVLADGLRIHVDGTEPHSELQRRLHDLRMQQLHRIAHELKTLDEPESPPTSRKYLN